jgi:hypothetical protein
MNTLSDMCGTPVFATPKRPAGRRVAPSGASFPAVEAQVQYREGALEVPIFLTLARVVATVLLVGLLIAYFIVALVVDEVKALWSRRRMSHTE